MNKNKIGEIMAWFIIIHLFLKKFKKLSINQTLKEQNELEAEMGSV